jgi:glutamate racemase
VVLREFLQVLPQYDYLYLGDNARIPYGTRSDRVVIRFTEQAVDYLFRQGCRLIVLACHTASARALRRIQQVWLPARYPGLRVLGVLIPTVEEAVARTRLKRIGVIATEGTVASQSFELELKKLDPEVEVVQQACSLLVPIIESGEQEWEGTTLILRRYLAPFEGRVDTLILGCTHYSILKDQIRAIRGGGPRPDLLRPGHRGQTGGLPAAPSRDGDPIEPGRHPPLPHHRPDAALCPVGQPVHGPPVEFRSSGVVKSSGQWLVVSD